MKNRQKIINQITRGVKEPLKSEIDYYMEVGYEPPYDLADAFYDVWNFADTNDERKLRKQCHQIVIDAGFLVPRPEMSETGRDTRIQHNKVKYDCVTAWSLWVDE